MTHGFVSYYKHVNYTTFKHFNNLQSDKESESSEIAFPPTFAYNRKGFYLYDKILSHMTMK